MMIRCPEIHLVFLVDDKLNEWDVPLYFTSLVDNIYGWYFPNGHDAIMYTKRREIISVLNKEGTTA